jgi:peptidyl-prolyl cis-trans isomerase D
MLSFIRERSKGVVAWVIVVIIIIPFALFGLDQFTSGDRIEVAAKVNGEPIQANEFARALENVKRQYQESFGDMYTSLVQEDKLRQQVLDDLIQRSAIDQQMQKEGFGMSDQLLAQVIQSQQMFQDKGVFSVQRYDEVLKNNGFTKERFEQAQRQFMLRNQLEGMVTTSEVIGLSELKALAGLESQEREIGYLRIDHRPFLSKVSVSEAEIKSYYEQNLARFKAPEQVSVDYVRLSVEDLAKSIKVTDEQLQTYYKDHPEKIQLPEKRNVRHILIMSPQEADATATEAAKNKVEGLLAQIKQGADFAELAKTNSEDPGSADRGGELGFFQRGDMVPEFEAAAFALTKEGDLSEVVKTSYGYHLLQLVAFEAAKTPSFAEVKELLAQELKIELALKEYNAKLEQLKTLTFEQDDSLKPAAEKLGLTIQSSPLMTAEGGEGVFAAPQVIEASFSSKVVKDKLNSAVVDVQMGDSMVVRVNQYQESRDKPLAEVSDEIRSLLQRQAAFAQAAELAKTVLAEAKASTKAPEALVKEGIEWKSSQWMTRNFDQVLPEILSAGFKAPKPAKDQISWVSHQLSTGDTVLIRVSAVRTDEAKLVKVADDLKGAAVQVFADAELEAVGNSIKNKAKIEVLVK